MPQLALPGRGSDSYGLVVALQHQGHHVGLIYTIEEEESLFIHLTNHLSLVSQSDLSGLHWVIPALPQEQLLRVVYLLLRIAETYAEGAIPYGFNPGEAFFTADGGLRYNGALGLSCSTFVSVTFASAGFPLVDLPSWAHASPERRAEDREERQKIVDFVRREHPDHANALEAEMDHPIRLRAVEVAAAFGMTPQPVGFVDAEREGRTLMEHLRSCGLSAPP